MGDGNKKGLDLPSEKHANLKTASSDEYLNHILLHIKSSKSPVNASLFNFYSCYKLRSLMVCTQSDWCKVSVTKESVCSQILPAFYKLSNQFPKLSFVYADIDECPETRQHIRYTSTFHFYRDGERVDEMFGAGEERLHDRLWLHS
ncbi:hypothetical protein Golob_015448 [Gossypium lobatum]|uniref:Thioredoxin domain-containing protein n=1 Tax=Gossypium lobatum TaxID=34289 RepID=A0A7J8M132_9ROSI|nr:hypothetical protein [Gossypium lobatum]